MVQTRSQRKKQATLEQPSRDVASPGVGQANPRRPHVPHQANAEVGGTNNDLGGNHEPSAGEHGVEFVKACQKRQCKLCPQFYASTTFTSSATKKTYKVKNFNKKKKLTCNTNNLVYLVTCDNCSCQYVGETNQQLNERFNDHRNRIKDPNKVSKSTLLVDHFNYGLCKGKNFKVQIIETIQKPGKYSNGKMNVETAGLRRNREKFWMKELRTVFPYGLNNKCDKNMDQRTAEDNIYSLFNKRKKNKHRRKNKKSHKENLTAQFVYNVLQGIPIRDSTCYVNKTIPQMKKKELKQLGQLLIEHEITEDSPITDRIANLVQDLLQHKLGLKKAMPKKNRNLNPVIILYENPAMGYINLQSILKLEEIQGSIDSHIQDDVTVSYRYTKSIRNKIFNYSNVVNEIDLDSWDINNQTCECDTTFKEYMDQHHKHVITGDLSIIRNKKLRELLRRGPNYRERHSINFQKARREINKGLNDFIEKHSKRKGVCREAFNEWKSRILEKVDEKIKCLRNGPLQKWRHTKQILQDKNCSKELLNLHNKFVVTPIDKASNNIALTCKTYYINNILQELNSDTYQQADCTEAVINEQVEKNKVLKCIVPSDDRTLPIIYAIVKMHKNPVKFRYIIAAKNVFLKKLPKD